MGASLAALVAAAAVAVLVLVFVPRDGRGRDLSGPGPAVGAGRSAGGRGGIALDGAQGRRGSDSEPATVRGTPVRGAAVGVEAVPSTGGQDPLVDDVAREVLARLVALLRSGLPRATAWELLRQGCRRRGGRSRDARRRDEQLEHWATALTRLGVLDAAGEDLVAAELPGPGTAWRDLSWAVGLAAATGAPLAELVARVGDDAAGRADAARARTAGMAAARSTRRILLWLPVGGLGLAAVLGADPVHVLLLNPWGRISAGIGLVFWAAAALWSRGIVAGAR